MTPSPAPGTIDNDRGTDPRDPAVGRTDPAAEPTDTAASRSDAVATSTDARCDRQPSTAPGRVSVEAVRAALASLADGSAPRSVDTGQSIDHQRVVWTARRATRRVETAAVFVSDGGLARLRDAVQAARRRGDEGVARRGQAVLDSVANYRRAAAMQEAVPDDPGTSDSDDRRTADGDGITGGTSDSDDRRAANGDGITGGTPGDDRSRGTILPGDGQTSHR